MPEELNKAPGTTEGGAPAGAAPAAPALPQDYEELKEKASRFDQLAQSLQPYADKIQRFYDDPEYADYVDNSYDTYKKLREVKKPELGPEWNPDNNPYVAEIKETNEFVRDLKKRQTEETKRNDQVYVNEAYQYAGRLSAENKQLADTLAADNGYWATAVLNRARSRGMSFEDGVKEFVQSFGVSAPAPRTPPSSLRPEAGASNITEELPGSTYEPGTFAKMSASERRRYMAAQVAKEQKKVS